MPDFGGPAFDDDATLMRSFSAGAFDEVIRRHGPAVRRVARSVAPDAVEDVFQQTFITAWTARLQFDEERGSLTSWLCTIAHNKALNVHRADQKHKGLRPLDDALEPVSPEESPLDQTTRQAEAAAVHEALQQLSPDQREALVMRFFGDMSPTEIQNETEAPLGTVRGRIKHGLEKLRDHLDSD